MEKGAVAFNEGGVIEDARTEVPLAGGEGGVVGGAVLGAGVLGGGEYEFIFSCFISTERKGCSRIVIGGNEVVCGVLAWVLMSLSCGGFSFLGWCGK